MRSLDEVLHDFEICYFNKDKSCNGCSYQKNGGGCSDNEHCLDKEVYHYLKGNNYEDSMSVGYENGMDVAWELAKTIKNMDGKDIQECFGVTNGWYGVMKKYTAQEALGVYDEWKDKKEKDKKELNIGDVISWYGNYAVVANAKYNNVNKVYLLFGDGSCGEHELDRYYKKVGHINIESFLQLIDKFDT